MRVSLPAGSLQDGSGRIISLENPVDLPCRNTVDTVAPEPDERRPAQDGAGVNPSFVRGQRNGSIELNLGREGLALA